MRKFILVAALLSLAMLCVAPALADDINPPPWRGHPGSTLQIWEFSTPNPNPLPDLLNNPFGMPTAQVWPGVGQNWWDVWEGRQGVWPLSGAMEITIPNSPVPNPYKDIWIQLTWMPQVPSVFPILSEMLSGAAAQMVHEIPIAGGWLHSTFNIRIYPNPQQEIVRIDGAVMVDELVIDTICVPEPSSLLALSGSVLALVAWRRRR
ncbi:MAG: PEP-CTERM sorting domain-containing protein [Armatimonadetes bacterium]|nr:PEP-CTERM sorting domain-containing protein [Armatimonadota bacterium]